MCPPFQAQINAYLHKLSRLKIEGYIFNNKKTTSVKIIKLILNFIAKASYKNYYKKQNNICKRLGLLLPYKACGCFTKIKNHFARKGLH